MQVWDITNMMGEAWVFSEQGSLTQVAEQGEQRNHC